MNILKASSLCIFAVLLTACHSNDDKHQPDEVVNKLTALGSTPADGEPTQIIDPSALKQDIASLFGNLDDDPLAVECGETDTLQAVIDRGGRA